MRRVKQDPANAGTDTVYKFLIFFKVMGGDGGFCVHLFTEFSSALLKFAPEESASPRPCASPT